VRLRASLAFALALLLLGLAWAPAGAGENEVFVRVVQVVGSGARGEKRAEMDKSLEPLRAHLEQASKHAHYALVGKSVAKKGTFGGAVVFELENHLKAAATATPAAEKKIKLVLQVTKQRERKEDEMVLETKLEMKDGATAVPLIEKALGEGDLLLAVTASRDSL
jgi:hypothetical protein